MTHKNTGSSMHNRGGRIARRLSRGPKPDRRGQESRHLNPPILKRFFYIAPPLLVAIAALAFLLGPNPERDRRAILAALIADPMPDFSLPPLEGSGVAGFSSADLQAGEVALVNVFASWCFPCRTEHQFLVQLAADRVAAIYGINYRDEPADAENWLADLGNP